MKENCSPALGVYAVEVLIGNQIFHGMLNIGIRPTVSKEGIVSCEVHIFDFNQNIYNQTITIKLIARLRGERKFEDIRELREQLEKDKAEVIKLFQR